MKESRICYVYFLSLCLRRTEYLTFNVLDHRGSQERIPLVNVFICNHIPFASEQRSFRKKPTSGFGISTTKTER